MIPLNSDQAHQLQKILGIQSLDFLIAVDKDQKQTLFYPPGIKIKQNELSSDDGLNSSAPTSINTLAALAPQPAISAIPPNCYYVTCNIGGLSIRILVCR